MSLFYGRVFLPALIATGHCDQTNTIPFHKGDGPLRTHAKRRKRFARTADTIGCMENNHENSDTSDRETARHGTKPVAGQRHQEPVNQRDVELLHSGAPSASKSEALK
jgi:hypothetical protein